MAEQQKLPADTINFFDPKEGSGRAKNKLKAIKSLDQKALESPVGKEMVALEKAKPDLAKFETAIDNLVDILNSDEYQNAAKKYGPAVKEAAAASLNNNQLPPQNPAYLNAISVLATDALNNDTNKKRMVDIEDALKVLFKDNKYPELNKQITTIRFLVGLKFHPDVIETFRAPEKPAKPAEPATPKTRPTNREPINPSDVASATSPMELPKLAANSSLPSLAV